MTGALIILIVTIAIGVILWAWEKFRSERHGNSLHQHNAPSAKSDESSVRGEKFSEDSDSSETLPSHNAQRTTHNAICCGLHAICEKTGQVNEPPVYYDDEELDRFAGRLSDSYSDDETEEFRDVLLTLLPEDAPGWSVSLEKRRICLPDELRPELELLLSEL